MYVGLPNSRVNSEGDILSESLAELQGELHNMVSAALRDRDKALSAQDRMACELDTLKNRLSHYQQKYQSACDEAQHARVSCLFCTVPQRHTLFHIVNI